MKTPAFSFLLVLVGCVASRGPVEPDGGSDAREDHHAEAASKCPLPSSGNDLSFDVDCTGACVATKHVDFHADDASSPESLCADGENLNVLLTDGPPEAATSPVFKLGIANYAGRGEYTIAPGSNKSLFEFGTSASCMKGGVHDFAFTIFGPGSDALSPPSCTVKVSQDCTSDDGTHVVQGSFSCAFPNAGVDIHCSLKNGTFALGRCSP